MFQTTYERIPLALVSPPSHRLRGEIDAEKLAELADSMAAEGLHQPVGVRGPDNGGRFEIIWGHRRYLAAMQLRWTDIPARVFPTEYDPLLASVSENLQRADLNPVEEARAVKQFLDRGDPLSYVARMFRRSQTWVRDRLDLLSFPADIVAAIEAGTLPLAVARELAGVDHDDYRASLVTEAQRVGASAATAQVWRAHYLADRERIVTNHATVEEIMSRREQWVIYADCESCRRPTDFRQTRSFRFCPECSRAVTDAIEGREPSQAAG